jgi:thiol-disulfide isomerase/thioredoxin
MVVTRRSLFLFLLSMLGASSVHAQTVTGSAAQFEPLEHWRHTVVAGDAAALASLYSTQPPVDVKIGKTESKGAGEELSFWQERRQAGLESLVLDDQNVETMADGSRQVIFQAEMTGRPGMDKARTWYVLEAQLWQKQQNTWRIVGVLRDQVRRLRQPMRLDPGLYPANVDAKAELSEALGSAAKSGKRVLLVFGANWCYDCDVLDLAFHHPDLQPFLEKNFVVVHVDIGKADKNLDLAERFHIPLEKGIPALAVLNRDGTLLYSQQNGEFESARSLAPEDLQAFLEKWKKN